MTCCTRDRIFGEGGTESHESDTTWPQQNRQACGGEAMRATGEVMEPAKDALATTAVFEKPKGGRLMTDEEFVRERDRQRRWLKERGML